MKLRPIIFLAYVVWANFQHLDDSQYPSLLGCLVAQRLDSQGIDIQASHETKISSIRDRQELVGISKRLLPYSIKSFASAEFKIIRQAFGISEKEWQNSFPLNVSAYVTSPSHGKVSYLLMQSRSQFYATEDGRFLIKTIPKREAHVLKKWTRSGKYSDYMNTYANETLLVPYFSLTKIRLTMLSQPLFFITLPSLLPGKRIFTGVDSLYDLKGSTNGRFVKVKKEGKKALRDLNWIQDGRSIQLKDSSLEQKFIDALARDSKFLESNNVIDYSLLLAEVRTVEEGSTFNAQNTFRIREGGIERGDGGILYAGIIDYLLKYQPLMLALNVGKSVMDGFADRNKYSLATPGLYQQRFFQFTSSIFANKAPKVLK